jgi:hypothetical protein
MPHSVQHIKLPPNVLEKVDIDVGLTRKLMSISQMGGVGKPI